jgi:hypothetical protein
MPNAAIERPHTRRNHMVPEDGGADTVARVFANEPAGRGLRGRGASAWSTSQTATRGAAFPLPGRVRSQGPARPVMSRANAMDRRSVPSACPPNHHQPENHRWSDCVPC